ncbi:MAG: hypothetical protein LUH09_08485 [Clostridiales bacterium]|nr:hypothetical protein [Clostridiales bacterium]
MEKFTKKDRNTDLYYDQTNAPMQIHTHDPKLIRKLTCLSNDYPELCRLTEVGECSGTYFEAVVK